MLTENIYNYRMEYPGTYVPNSPPTSYFPITPPYTHPYDSPPPPSSAFTAVGKSEHKSILSTTVPLHSISTADRIPQLYSSQPLYFPFYQPITPPHHHEVYPTPPPLTSSSSLTPSPPLIRQLLMKPHTSIISQRAFTSTTTAVTTIVDDDDDDVIFVDDDKKYFDESTIRTSVIRKTTERSYEDAVSKSMRSFTTSDAPKRLGSESTAPDEEIICKWKSCFR